jgi:chromate transport protein ChrA
MIATIGMLVLAVIQYVKSMIPDKLVPVASILAGIGVAFLLFYDPKVGYVDPVVVIANGVLGAVGADSGYQFLSSKTSPPLSLPSKNGKPNTITITEVKK